MFLVLKVVVSTDMRLVMPCVMLHAFFAWCETSSFFSVLVQSDLKRKYSIFLLFCCFCSFSAGQILRG